MCSTLAEHSPPPAMALHSGLPVTWAWPSLEPSAMIKEVSEGSFQPCLAMLLGTHPFLLGKGSQLDPQQRHPFQSGLQQCQGEGEFFPDVLGETEEKKGQNFCTLSFFVVTACRYAGREGRHLEGSGKTRIKAAMEDLTKGLSSPGFVCQ